MPRNWPMWFGLALGLGAAEYGFTAGSTAQERWQLAACYTARVGFPILILAYVARPLHQVSQGRFGRFLLARRRAIGLGFALSHSVHLVALITALRLSGETPPPATLLGGGLGYVVLYAMALTSFEGARKHLGRSWTYLHRFGIHYLWLIFAISYASRIADSEKMAVGITFGAVALAAACLRLAAWIGTRQRQSRRRLAA